MAIVGRFHSLAADMSKMANSEYPDQTLYCLFLFVRIQYNLNGSNSDVSFTVDDSSSFLSPYEILPIAQENKYLRKFSYFIVELYVVCTH